MQNVKIPGLVIKRSDFLERLAVNQEIDDEIYQEALADYQAEVEELAEDAISTYEEHLSEFIDYVDNWEAGEPFQPPTVPLNKTYPTAPVSHFDKFEGMIDKVNLSKAESFELTETEFQNYVRNNWKESCLTLSFSTLCRQV